MKTYTLSLTGHRPNKLWGYNLNEGKYPQLKQRLMDIIAEKLADYHTVICHSGMALGADTVWAQAIIQMQRQYPTRIIFVADIPCVHQEHRWPESSQRVFHEILTHANQQIVYAPAYNYKCMQDRNIGMIDACDELIAIWNGDDHGGTANAVHYAQQTHVSIHRIAPDTL